MIKDKKLQTVTMSGKRITPYKITIGRYGVTNLCLLPL
ncbi:hypothetical protein YPPY66_2837 [Yersinia pestis PY-66]|uniref:Uncharacterized protein n=2 Tax=Yersinia pseudotuberculosis complex TaxID=1649845 RepID=A0A0U1QZ24_YERP3|nr:hypothetical protein YpsIP31758_1906 [Yersinia pseudotuberculosis IP 31758]EIQ88000.1 hypothetical protein YPPY01_2535 [Yersinia pestis PY-01]EIQ89472.1 hypothetical protein YPPY02_2568 [Yersinia pestis PY-02]EIQ90365.1 hypothetical protein YPPY03_2623 [Yersinia pestis PY-03]EIR01643.1 hypothetical protein YPPY04_2603 [Yersinia pestis PY-04]EIR03153.1 hypothetical protein YPPY05_2573 [Yersinia pestis PY-05]EIR06313.1 hypothetical protein YPPY06_2629 [Yersinia pestis PY-06]EIR17201.1 hypot